MPLSKSLLIASLTSTPDFVENRVNQAYPVRLSSIMLARTLYNGISSRTMVTSNGLEPMRPIFKSTRVPFFPLNFLYTLSRSIPLAFFPSISVIQSPASMPAFSDGPPTTGAMTVIYSFKISNSIPIPWNSPLNISAIFF